ncbi:hypothetical protein GCM10011611_47950 [Aliidongia dinghuensis]|uniref:Uncharacterized protein n=1 Tax=Aliidongia dinghuensis TaxID=1867774 RepID=A0A8J2YXG3_9PROT|nr:hypothetical protein [Aliidongia dinghuensis]GGF35990.1 hypothetical protein GCM10011611_47950 [Aliidongia dinghuensis]
MNLDLLSMAALSVSAFVVITTMAKLLGSSWQQRITIGIVLGIWFVGVAAVGASEIIVGGGPIRTAGLGVLVVVPILILSAFTFLSERQMKRVKEFELLPLISVQALRILGVIFVLLFAANRLPGPFAPLAGYGDMSVGILAVPLAWAVASRKTPPRLPIYLWSALGMGDLINALVLGVLSAPSPFQVFKDGPGSAIMPMLPWILIPGFMVPAFFFLHLVVLAKLRQREPASSTRLTPKPA